MIVKNLSDVVIMDEPTKSTNVHAIMKKFEASINIHSNTDKTPSTMKPPVSCGKQKKTFVPTTSPPTTESSSRYSTKSPVLAVSSEDSNRQRGIVRRTPVFRRPDNIRLNTAAQDQRARADEHASGSPLRSDNVVQRLKDNLEKLGQDSSSNGLCGSSKFGDGADRIKTTDNAQIPVPVPRKRNRLKSNFLAGESSHYGAGNTVTSLQTNKICESSEGKQTSSSPTKICFHERLKALKVEHKNNNERTGTKLSDHHTLNIHNDNMNNVGKYNDIDSCPSNSKSLTDARKNEASQFSISSLPPGPPPEKPPRTFEHDIYIGKKFAKIQVKNDRVKDGELHEYDCVAGFENTGVVQKNTSKFEAMNVTENDMSHYRIPHNSILSQSRSKSCFVNPQEVYSHNSHSSRLVTEMKPPLKKTHSDLPEVPLHHSEKAKWPDRPLVSPYAVSDIHNSLLAKDPLVKQNSAQPVPKSRSRFFVELNISDVNTTPIKRSASDDHIYEEPLIKSKVGNGYHHKHLTRTVSADSEEVFINNIEYDKITCEPNIDMDENDITDQIRPKPNLTRGLHYLSSPIRIQRVRTHSFNDGPSKRFQNGCERVRNHRDKRVVPVAVRDLINQSFHRVSNYQRNNSSLYPPVPDDDSGDSDCELSPAEVQERIEYIRTVSRTTSVKYDKQNRPSRLFDHVLVVGLQCTEKTGLFEPYIKLSHPTLTKPDFEKWVPHVSFPDAEFWKPSGSGETYMSIFTDEMGKRTYGYCRRIKPDGCSVCLPIVYCIISPVMDFNFFQKLLEELEKMYGYCDSDMLTFLKYLHQKPLPKSGHEITVHNRFLNSDEVIKRSENPAVDSYGLDTLLSELDVLNLVKVFASLLLERKVLLHSSSVSRLSQCVQGLHNLLYPFTWDHTFVPVLPGCAIEVLCSPMPFLIGILNDDIPKLKDIAIEGVLMVDLDKKRIQHEHGDELKVIPKKLQKSLIEALKSTKSMDQNSRSLTISEAFLRVFVETVGSYSNYIVTQQDGKKVFEREPFCLGTTLKSATSFLQWFTETQMFYSFIDAHLDGTAVQGLFDIRVQEYNVEMNNLPISFRENIKEFGKKVKNIGEKLIGLRSPAKLEARTLEKMKPAET